jgi:hypothetical protein
MKDEYAVGDDDPVYLDDVALMSANARTATRGSLLSLELRARRDHSIYRCYGQGDVSDQQLAEASGLSLGYVRAIRRRLRPPWPKPVLKLVR